MLTRTHLSQVFRAADEGTLGQIEQEKKRELQAAPLEQDGKRVELPQSVKMAVEELRRVPVDKVVRDAETLEAWARAHFDAGQTEDAIEGYRRAVELDPKSARLRYAYAIALKYGGRPQVDVVVQLAEALRLARIESDLVLKERIYVSYTYNTLYLSKPEGFRKAREAALEYVADSQNKPSAEIWTNLACSWGQEAGWSQESSAQSKQECIRALEKALELDPGWQPRLQSLVEGTAGDDDDLTVFRNDNYLRRAVGLPPISA